MKRFWQKKYLMIAVAIVLLAGFFFLRYRINSAQTNSAPAVSSTLRKDLPKFTAKELKKYNGTNPNLPIYLVLDGNVYDVTKGSEFYKVGGPYHFLAGKDSSLELHIVGGDIIKRKYSIVGKYVN